MGSWQLLFLASRTLRAFEDIEFELSKPVFSDIPPHVYFDDASFVVQYGAFYIPRCVVSPDLSSLQLVPPIVVFTPTYGAPRHWVRYVLVRESDDLACVVLGVGEEAVEHGRLPTFATIREYAPHFPVRNGPGQSLVAPFGKTLSNRAQQPILAGPCRTACALL